MESFVINDVSDIGKYSCFHLSDGREIHGKYGYFSSAMDACEFHFGDRPEFPVTVKLDERGIEYFHVDGILHHGVWVKCKF